MARQLRILQAYAIFSLVALIFVATAALGQPAGPQRFDEITVQRLNVVDANGTLRFVLSNRDRMHPGVMDGVMIDRPRPVAGMLFFNDEGDEVGGLTYSAQASGGERRASAQIAFDQYKQDQTIALSYSESNGRRMAGLQVWDRSDTPLTELIRQLNAANALRDPAERDKAIKAARAAAPPGPRRVFVGKNTEREATVSLADASGRPRLRLTVTAEGEASIEFLDTDGKVVNRLTGRP